MEMYWIDFEALMPTYAIRIGTALLCGFLLGLEREHKNKPAGLRTIVLITVGSTVFMIVSESMPSLMSRMSFPLLWSEGITRVDPGRIAAQVVSGIGFLGAGSIIQARGAVHGLTTAAVIWVAAAIGLCIGIGYPLFAFALTLVVLVTLVVMEPLRNWVTRRGAKETIELLAPNDSLVMQRLLHALYEHDIQKKDVESHVDGKDLIRLRIVYYARGDAAYRLLNALSMIEGVRGTRHVET